MRMRLKSNRRKGAALIVVLVCLGVIGALLLTALQTSLQQRKQLDRELQMEQTRWLAEAGVLHAKKLIQKASKKLGVEPVVIRPKLDDTHSSEIQIKFIAGDDSTDVDVTAWIGLVDRPETQTRQTIQTQFKNGPERD